MKKIIALCTLTLVLTGCHEAETKVAQKQDKKIKQHVQNNSSTVEMKFVQNNHKKAIPVHEKMAHQSVKQLKREISTEVALHIPKVKPITNKYEYVDTVKDYSKDMEQVIDTMTLYEDKKDIEQQLKKVKTIVVKYEAKVQTAKALPQVKNVDAEVKKANEKYIQSLGKIASAIQTEDEALKNDGYTDFSEGHNHLNKAYYQVQSIEDKDSAEMNIEPSTEIAAQSSTSETPTLEIVMYKSDGTEELPIEEPSSEDKPSSNMAVGTKE